MGCACMCALIYCGRTLVYSYSYLFFRYIEIKRGVFWLYHAGFAL